MRIRCSGTAIIGAANSGQTYEITPDELDWEPVDGRERSMGPETHYQASIEHEALGLLSWNLWEYPVGIQGFGPDTNVGESNLIKDFDYGLEHEDDRDLGEERAEWDTLTEREQIERMTEWFFSMFEDPQNQTPYAADEDSPYNYEYIWGGPYDAADELSDQFSGMASDSAIEKATDIVQDRDGILEWAPSSLHPDMRRAADEASFDREDDVASSALRRLGELVTATTLENLGTVAETEARARYSR